MEALSGKNTLHDTVGIVYQSLSEETSRAAATALENRASASGDSTSGRKRRRTFKSFGVDIEPYHKKSKISSIELVPLEFTDRQRIPESYQVAKVNDLLWMIQFSILPKSTAMWVGWNVQHRIDKKATEKIWYLPAINQSPTSTVVKETMKRAQQLAVECGKREVALTYDLAIAKMVMEIQTEEAPTFDDIFVTLGSFHIEMAFFSVIGKYNSESGGPHLLAESGIIENGSLTSFLLGKSYKRSKRIHQLLALAMEIQHCNSFKLSLQEFISLEDDLPMRLMMARRSLWQSVPMN